jgi:hypothetical protein
VPAGTAVPALLDNTMSPVALADPTVMPGLYAEDGWDDVEVPRGPVDPRWRNTVIAFAQSRRYEGVNCEQSFSDNETRLQRYKNLVQQAISLCQGRRLYKASLDMVASYFAIALCKGRAQLTVQQFLDKIMRLPLKRELFFLLDEDMFSIYIAESRSEDISSSLGSEDMLS